MPAPVTADEFLHLVRSSGVVDAQRLTAYLKGLHDTGALPAEPPKLAGLLVRDGILTIFQAEQILQGKWRRFTIGRYKALERIGCGRAGGIYLCADPGLSRRVAVKVLPTSLSTRDPLSVRRFHCECQILASLDHANIVRLYDVGQDDTLHYFAMEYVDGSSLQEIIKKVGPMDVTRAAHYVRQAALGLQHVHERGFVHRDIKPSDILVDRSGVVKIIDMGLARPAPDENTVTLPKYDGPLLGTPDYIAPEQIVHPSRVDIRADIYSLGATFYFCLAGWKPFPDSTVAQTLTWHRTVPPEPIRERRPEVPESLAALIERMMAKNPAQRPQTPQEVADALAPLTEQPIGPPPEEEMPRLSPAARGDQPPPAGT